jgi:hypothetical protein
VKFIASVILGLVLGISDFLPVSSVDHSLVLSSLLSFPPTQVERNAFAVFIEGGAWLAFVLCLGRDFFKQARQFSSDRQVRRLWLNVWLPALGNSHLPGRGSGAGSTLGFGGGHKSPRVPAGSNGWPARKTRESAFVLHLMFPV